LFGLGAIRCLLDAGADIDRKTREDDDTHPEESPLSTSLDWLRYDNFGWDETGLSYVSLLLRYGPDLDECWYDDKSAEDCLRHIENPDAFPWLSMDNKIGSGEGDELPGAGGFDGAEDGDFDGAGLPAHLDVDPQELFLNANDKVVPGCDEDDLLPAADEDGGFGTGLDFDLVDQPTTVGSTDISYSRNSKFVDVKLVKKHLWECINQDIGGLPDEDIKTATSFQELVSRTVDRMPKSECENLSIQVCFICALHLCNEKGLEFDTTGDRPLSGSDFKVVGSKKMTSSTH